MRVPAKQCVIGEILPKSRGPERERHFSQCGGSVELGHEKEEQRALGLVILRASTGQSTAQTVQLLKFYFMMLCLRGVQVNLVFASGFLLPQKIIGKSYFKDLPIVYPEACFTRVPVAGSVQQRAQMLAKQIAQRFPVGAIHIIAHSMGGLDARYLLTHNLLGLANPGRVVSLSTIATPHRGSPVADLLVGARPELKDPRRFAYDVISRTLSRLGVAFGALGDLTTGFAEQFNQDNPALDHVRYLPYAGCGKCSLLLIPTHTYIERCGDTADEKLNDGLVSVASASWPGPLFEPPWPTDHLGEVGHNVGLLGPRVKFDHLVAFDHVIRNATKRMRRTLLAHHAHHGRIRTRSTASGANKSSGSPRERRRLG